MENKKVKVTYLRWELSPVYNEVYIDEEELKQISEIDCDDERLEYIEDLLTGPEFIWTCEDTDIYMETGELDKHYIENNEYSIYVSSVIRIDDDVVSKNFNTYIEKEMNELSDELYSLEVSNIKSIIRDRKLNKILK